MKKIVGVLVVSLMCLSIAYGYSAEQLRDRLQSALAEHGVSQAEEDAILEKLFAGLGSPLYQSPYIVPETVPQQIGYTLTTPSYTTPQYAQNSRATTDGRYYRPALTEVSGPMGRASIDHIASHHASTEIRGDQILLHSQQLELFVDVRDSYGETLPPSPGYVVVAQIGDHQQTLNYQYASQAWYLTRSIATDERAVEIAVLCESCGGSRYGVAGPYADWYVTDSNRYSLTPVKYRGYEPEYTTDDDRYFVTTSQSFALDAKQVWTQEQSFTIALSITNESVRPGRLSTNDLKVTLQSQKIPTSQLGYRVTKGALDCEDGQGKPIQVQPMRACTVEISVDLYNMEQGGQLGVTVEHTTSTNRDNTINRRVTLPRKSN